MRINKWHVFFVNENKNVMLSFELKVRIRVDNHKKRTDKKLILMNKIEHEMLIIYMNDISNIEKKEVIII